MHSDCHDRLRRQSAQNLRQNPATATTHTAVEDGQHERRASQEWIFVSGQVRLKRRDDLAGLRGR